MFAEDDKAPLPAQCSAQRGLFGGEQAFVEPACRAEGLTGAEEKTAGRQAQGAVNGRCKRRGPRTLFQD